MVFNHVLIFSFHDAGKATLLLCFIMWKACAIFKGQLKGKVFVRLEKGLTSKLSTLESQVQMINLKTSVNPNIELSTQAEAMAFA
jgi:hypothetical protein